MATLDPIKLTGTLKVQTGTTETGNPKLSSVSMGKFKYNINTTASVNNLFALGEAIATCILNMVNRIEISTTSQILEE